MNIMTSWLSQGIREAAGKIRMLSRGKLNLVEQLPCMKDLTEIGEELGGDDAWVCSIGMTLMVHAPLALLIVMKPEALTRLAAVLVGPAAASNKEMATSALQEIGNLFGTGVSNCLGRYLGVSVRTSIPEYVEDMAGALASVVVGALDSVSDQVFLVKTEIRSASESIPCNLLMLADPSLENVFRAKLEQQGDLLSNGNHTKELL